MTAAQLLREARRRAGLRQWEAAQALHLDRTTLGQYEAGRRPVPADVMARAGRLYGAPELLAVAGEGPFGVRIVPDQHVAVAMDWFAEEAEEALAAAERIVRALRRQEAPTVEDMAEVIDLRMALDTFIAAAWRAGCPVDAADAVHRDKASRLLRRQGVA